MCVVRVGNIYFLRVALLRVVIFRLRLQALPLSLTKVWRQMTVVVCRDAIRETMSVMHEVCSCYNKTESLDILDVVLLRLQLAWMLCPALA